MFTLLIVDDNPADRKGITGLVNWHDFNINVIGTAVNGEEGYEKAVELKPDFIITDVAMPRMNGIEMTNMLKDKLPHTRFIFMSCFDDVEYLQSAINLEVSAYILKPVNLDELIDAVKKVKELRQSYLEREKNEKELKKFLDDSLPILKEQFVKELFYGIVTGSDDIIQRTNYLKMDFSHRYYTVLYLKIDNYDIVHYNVSIEKKHLIIYSMQKLIQDTLLAETPGYVTTQQYSSAAVIIFFDTDDIDGAMNLVIDRADKCIELINSGLNISVTIGVSHFSENITDIHSLYKNAEYAALSKFYSKGNKIILYSEVKEPDDKLQYNLQVLKHEIDSLLEKGEDDDLLIFINRYYNPEITYSPQYIKSLSYSIVNIIQTILIEKNKDLSDILDEEIPVWRKLSLFDTILDIRNFLMNILRMVSQLLRESEAGNSQNIIEDIKSVIDEQYAVINNVNDVVKGLYISASHANLLFKKSTGQTIFDYLIFRKMEIAKRLLLDPYIRVYDIPEKIGYKTISHFRTVFKEYTGQTPKQYQNNHMK